MLTLRFHSAACTLCHFHTKEYKPDFLNHFLWDSHQNRTKAASCHSSEDNKKRSVVVFGIQGLPLKDVLAHFAPPGILITNFVFWKESPDICLVQFLLPRFAEAAATNKERKSIHGKEVIITLRDRFDDNTWWSICPADNPNKIKKNLNQEGNEPESNNGA